MPEPLKPIEQTDTLSRPTPLLPASDQRPTPLQVVEGGGPQPLIAEGEEEQKVVMPPRPTPFIDDEGIAYYKKGEGFLGITPGQTQVTPGYAEYLKSLQADTDGPEVPLLGTAMRAFMHGAVGLAQGGTAGVIGDIISKEAIEKNLPITGPVDKIAHSVGEFVGFVSGAPVRIGSGVAMGVLKSPVGKKFAKWFASKVGERALGWLTEGLGLGIATSISNSQDTLETILDPSMENLGNEIANRAEGFVSGAVTGARFGIIRDTINKFAFRAAANLAISNMASYVQNGQEAPPLEDMIFNSLLDVWFSKHRAAPTPQQRKATRELVNKTMMLVRGDGIDPQRIAREVVEEARTTTLSPIKLKKEIAEQLKVQHGTPAIIDQFDIKKVGSGEGAAAFGHGLYFTSLKDVARYYSESVSQVKPLLDLHSRIIELSNQHGATLGPRDLNRIAVAARSYYMSKLQGDTPPNFVEHVRDYLKKIKGVEMSAPMEQFTKLIEGTVTNWEVTKPQLIRARLLSKREQFNWIDWDKPLTTEQKEQIRPAVEQAVSGIENPNLRKTLVEEALKAGDNGAAIYKYLATHFGGDEAKASRALSNAGFDGIRYPTASMSGGELAGEGKNYVLFDSDMVEVLTRSTPYMEHFEGYDLIRGDRFLPTAESTEPTLTLRPPERDPIRRISNMTGERMEKARALGKTIVETQSKINKWTESQVKTEDGERYLLELRAEQRENLEALSILTDKVWEYNPQTKQYEIAGDLPKELKHPELFDETIDPQSPTWMYERVKETMMTQKMDELEGMALMDALGGEVQFLSNPEKISDFADIFWGPEFALREYPYARALSAKIVEGQELLDYQVRKDYELFDRWFRRLPRFARGKESVAVGDAIENVYKLRAAETRLAKLEDIEDLPLEAYEKIRDLSGLKSRIERDKKLNPGRYEVAENIIQWWDNVRELIKTHKREMIRQQRPQEWFEAFNAAISESYDATQGGKLKSPEERAKLWEGITKRYGIEKKKEIDKFTDMVRDYLAVDFWGVDDYITRIERGTYKVLDENGQVRAVRQTGIEAREEAESLVATGQIRKAKIVNEYSKVDPLTRRKGVLKGEKNIFDALRSYAWAVRKRLIVEPLQLAMEQEFSNNADKYTPNMQKIVRKQMEALKGTYSWEDRLIDGVFEKLGFQGKPFRASRWVGRARKAEGYLKLGYRPVASAVNLVFGHGHTIAKTGTGYWIKGLRWLRTPEGKEWMKAQEPYMGVTFSEFEGATREIKSWLNPLWLFSRPERNIRRASLASNYLFGREKLGMDEVAAREFSHRSMRAQSFVYNTTALPRWMRSPLGKLVGQFKSYIVQEMQFLKTLSGKEWTRYMTLMATFGGPQAILHVLNSLPLLNQMGVLDKIEEYLLSVRLPKDIPLIGGNRVLYGIPGLLGMDISISAALQFPGSFDELAGPFVADVLKLGRMAMDAADVGFEEAFGIKEFKESKTAVGKAQAVTDKLGQFAVELNYFNDILTSKFQMQPDGRMWARDRQGRLSYPIDGTLDYIKLIAGAKPIQKSVYQAKLRILNKEKERRIKRAREVVRRSIRLFNSEGRFPEGFEEELLEVGVWDANGFIQTVRSRQLTPEQRMVLGEARIDQLRALDVFYEEMYKQIGEELK